MRLPRSTGNTLRIQPPAYLINARWITVERATPSTEQQDREIWMRVQNRYVAKNDKTQRLKRLVEKAGYRTTFRIPARVNIAPYNEWYFGENFKGISRRPMEMRILKRILDKIGVSTAEKIIKVRRQGGFTLRSAPGAVIGDSELIDGEVYTIRSEAQLRRLVRTKKYDEVRRTCTSFIRDMSGLFAHYLFNENIDHWDTSNVIDMANMFNDATLFNQPIGIWDTRNVKKMAYMFYHASSFNQPIGDWDIRNVTTMKHMFKDSGFTQDLSSWHDKLNPYIAIDRDTRARIKLNISQMQFAFHNDFYNNAQDPIYYYNHVPFNRGHILAPELIKHNNVYKIRRVYDTNSVNRSIRPSMTSPFTRASLAPGDIIKLSTIANKLVPQRGNTKKKRRLKNQYERIVLESKLRDVINEINSITKRRISNNAKKTILNELNLPRQRKILENKLRAMKNV